MRAVHCASTVYADDVVYAVHVLSSWESGILVHAGQKVMVSNELPWETPPHLQSRFAVRGIQCIVHDSTGRDSWKFVWFSLGFVP